MIPGQDPYFTHYYRINFDGTGPDPADRRRRQPHGHVFARPEVLRGHAGRAWTCRRWRNCGARKTGRWCWNLDKGDATALLAAGFRLPEVFVAKGRDGKTDIWGIIIRPTAISIRRRSIR